MPRKIDVPPQEVAKKRVCACLKFHRNPLDKTLCMDCGHHFNDHTRVGENGDYYVGPCYLVLGELSHAERVVQDLLDHNNKQKYGPLIEGDVKAIITGLTAPEGY